MKRFLYFMVVLLSVCSVFCISAYAIREFSSVKYDMIISSPQSTERTVSTVYVKEKNFRMETEIRGAKSIIIFKEDRTGYMYYPEQNMVMMMSMPKEGPGREIDYAKRPEMKLVGEDFIEGRVCEVYEGIIEGSQIKLWQDKQLDFPVRIEASTKEGKVITEFKNVEISPYLNDSLFEIPAGTKVMDMSNLGEMMKVRESPYGR